MAVEREAEQSALGKAAGLCAGAFAFLTIVTAIAAQLGLDETIIAFVLIAFTLVTCAIVGVVSRTLSLGDFYVAGRSIPAGFNGMATAAAFLSAGGLAGLIGAFFADESAGLAIAIGWSLGFVLLAVAIAPYYRKSGAVTVPDFLAVRFGNPLIRLAGIIGLVITTFALLPASIAAAGMFAGTFLHLRPDVALITIVAVLLFSSLFGGMRAATFVTGTQAILILIGVLVPPALLATQSFGLPLPWFTFGYAIEAVGNDGARLGALPSVLFPLPKLDWLSLAALSLSLAAGVASLPHVLARSGTARGVAGARRAPGWALVVIGAIVVTAPAIAGFARQAIVENVVGTDIDSLPDWLFTLGERGLISVCGAFPSAPAEIGTACGAAKVVAGLGPADIAVSSDAIALGFADITGIPYVMTALIAAALLAAALATANAVLMAITASLGHDLYGRFVNRRATAGRRLILSRLILIATIAVAAWLAATQGAEMLAIAVLCPSLAASAFFPALVLGVWWRRTTWVGALAGMIAGLGSALGYVLLVGLDTTAATLDAGIPAIASAIIGVPLGFIVAVGVSLVTPPPSDARLEVVDAIRRPSHDPILEDHAA